MTLATLPAASRNGGPPATATIETTAPLDPAIMEAVVVGGDLAKLTPSQRLAWYRSRCEAAGLDPRTQPFSYLMLNGKLTLYATKTATDQLISGRRLSVKLIDRHYDPDTGLYEVVCQVTSPDGATVEDIGVVNAHGLRGEALSNAQMKCCTKAKRRTVLSACGLGMLDETEIDSIPDARWVDPDQDQPEQDRRPALPPPQNNSGYGRGQYASPEQIADYKKAMEGFLAKANAQWADVWSNRCRGEVPKGVKEIPIFQADGHLLKWAVETGRLDPQIVPSEAKSRQLAAYTAIVYHRSKGDQRALAKELERYIAEQHERQAEAIYRAHPELRPEEDASQETPDDDMPIGDELAPDSDGEMGHRE